MLCSKCKIVEMKMDKVEDNKMYFKCKRCGNEAEKTIEEMQQQKAK